MRQAYACDCAGEPIVDVLEIDPRDAGMVASVRAVLGAIESLVGYRPTTCPWRAFYHPLVTEVMDVVALSSEHLGLAYLGTDPPAILVDAIALYLRCKAATLAHFMEADRKKREAERAAAQRPRTR